MTNLSEKVPVQISVDEDSEGIAIDRRMFVKGVGFAVLTAQCLSLIACASGNSPSYDNEAANNLIIHSSSGYPPHVHDLLIPYAVLNAPPLQGVESQDNTNNVARTQGGVDPKRADHRESGRNGYPKGEQPPLCDRVGEPTGQYSSMIQKIRVGVNLD
jgi:hypothetical protein